MNYDVKIFIKIIANQLNIICADVIGPYQRGFVTRRLIQNVAMDVLTVLRNQTDQSKYHQLLLVDQQKAFDRVNHGYLRMVLNKMNFDKKFVNIVNALFSSQQAYITDSGLLSEPFRVERGVCQRDPLSLLLYTLAIEPLLKYIYEKIYGIEIKNQCFKINIYADDLTIGIGFQSDWLDLLEIIKTYEAASNTRVNRSKTMLIPLTVIAQDYNLTSECNFRKVTKDKPISILGYKVDS